MKKTLLFVIAISLSAVAFAAPHLPLTEEECSRFAPPNWGANIRGCKTCPVKDANGNLITCSAPSHLNDCCWLEPLFGVSNTNVEYQHYSCTTDYWANLHNYGQCEELLEKAYDNTNNDTNGTNNASRRNGNGKKGGKNKDNIKPSHNHNNHATVKPTASVRPTTPVKPNAPVKPTIVKPVSAAKTATTK